MSYILHGRLMVNAKFFIRQFQLPVWVAETYRKSYWSFLKLIKTSMEITVFPDRSRGTALVTKNVGLLDQI